MSGNKGQVLQVWWGSHGRSIAHCCQAPQLYGCSFHTVSDHGTPQVRAPGALEIGTREQAQATGGAGSPAWRWARLALPLPGLLSIVCSFAKLKLLELKMSMSCVCPQLIPFAFESSNRKIWLPQKMRWGRIICFGHVISACK